MGWIPLLAIKVFREGSLLPFILSAITVALPIIAGMVWLDTKFYGSDEWVFTSYNFLEMNLIHGLSKFFGTDPWHVYILHIWPIFTVMAPVVYLAIPRHALV